MFARQLPCYGGGRRHSPRRHVVGQDRAAVADLPAPLARLRQGLLRHPGGGRVMAKVLAAVPAAPPPS